jgi:MtN3 and saliva related transmembrane protein
VEMLETYIVWFVEFMFGMSMFLNAVLFIPQAMKIYKTKNAKDLSPITFVGFNIIQVFTIMHGYIRNDYPLMFGFLLSLVISSTVTVLIFMFRK